MTVKHRMYYGKSIMETWIDRQAQMDLAVNKAMKQGLEQGIEQGAAQSRMEIARAMLAKGYDVKSIIELTGINPDEEA